MTAPNAHSTKPCRWTRTAEVIIQKARNVRNLFAGRNESGWAPSTREWGRPDSLPFPRPPEPQAAESHSLATRSWTWVDRVGSHRLDFCMAVGMPTSMKVRPSKIVGLFLLALLVVAALLVALMIIPVQENPPMPQGPSTALSYNTPVPGVPSSQTDSGKSIQPGGDPSSANADMPVGPIFPVPSQKKSTHWFLRLGARGFGMTSSDWIRQRVQTASLGAPRGDKDPLTLDSFDYVFLQNSCRMTEGTPVECFRLLLQEAEQQHSPTFAHPMLRFPDASVLEGKSLEEVTASPEVILPIAPGTQIQPPLQKGHQNEALAFRVPLHVPPDQKNAHLTRRLQEIRDAGFRLISPFFVRYDDPAWFDQFSNHTEPEFEAILLVQPLQGRKP